MEKQTKAYCLRCGKVLLKDDVEIRKPREPLGKIDRAWGDDKEHAYHKNCGGRVAIVDPARAPEMVEKLARLRGER